MSRSPIDELRVLHQALGEDFSTFLNTSRAAEVILMSNNAVELLAAIRSQHDDAKAKFSKFRSVFQRGLRIFEERTADEDKAKAANINAPPVLLKVPIDLAVITYTWSAFDGNPLIQILYHPEWSRHTQSVVGNIGREYIAISFQVN